MAIKCWFWIGACTGVFFASVTAGAVEEIAEHRQKEIREAAPAEPPVEPRQAHTVLVFNTPDHLYDKDPHKGYCVPYGSYAMRALGEKSVAYHFATGANRHWPEFLELLGAAFAGHPWNEEVGIKVDDPGHPLVAAFGGKDFRIADEIYQFSDPSDRKKPQDLSKVRVLLSIDKSKTNMDAQWINRNLEEFPQAWVRSYGKGRVFYTGLGHRAELYRNPTILQFYLGAIQFACGDLPADTTPAARQSKQRR